MSTIAITQTERFRFLCERDGAVKARAFLFENVVRTYRKAVLGIRATGRYAMYRRPLSEAYCAAKRLIASHGELAQAHEALRAGDPASEALVRKYVPMLEHNIALDATIQDGYRIVAWVTPSTIDDALPAIYKLFRLAGWQQADFGPGFAMKRPEPGA